MIWTSVALGGEPLTKTDQEVLTKLFHTYDEDASVGKITNYPKYFNKRSLTQLMTEHRKSLDRERQQTSEAELSKYYTFNPDLKSVLLEGDPYKYFARIANGQSEIIDIRDIPGICCRVVGIAGDRDMAFIVVKKTLAGRDDSGSSSYSVWPALIEDGEWRMDATTTLARDLKLLNQVSRQKGILPSKQTEDSEGVDGKPPQAPQPPR